MKRGLICGIFIFMFLIEVINADTGWVGLNIPQDNFFAAKYALSSIGIPQNFKCEVHSNTAYQKVILFSNLNIDNEWKGIIFISKNACLNNICTFVLGATPVNSLFNIQNVNTGVYKWTCAYMDSNGNLTFSQTNRTIIFTRDRNVILGSGKFIFKNPGSPFSSVIQINKNHLTIQRDESFEQELKLRNSFFLIYNGNLSDDNLKNYSVAESSNLTVKIKNVFGDSNSKIINITPDSGYTGETYILFNATKERLFFPDFSGTSGKLIIIVNGSSITNQAPVFSGPMGPFVWFKNTNKTINLNTYFTDPNGDSLNYTATTPPQNFQIKIIGNQITFIPAINFIGIDYTSITASDGTNSVTAQNILLNVTESTSLPTLTIFPSTSPVILEVGESKLFSVTANGFGNAVLNIFWLLDGIKVGNLTNYTYPAQVIPKNQTLKVNVSSQHYTVSATWNIKVIPDESIPNENDSCINPLCVCASNTCTGRTCVDAECGTTCQGTKTCNTNIGECDSDSDCALDEECLDGSCEIKETPPVDFMTYLIWGAVGILGILIIIGVVFLIKTLKKNKQFKQLPKSSSGPVYPR